MPSPFPGMNPYLEQAEVWHDFHETFLITLRAELTQHLGDRYIARVEDHILIQAEENGTPSPLGIADLAVKESTGGKMREAAGLAIAAPLQVQLTLSETEREIHLEVLDRKSRRVITVVEVLSPSNKYAGRDRDVYLARRDALFRSPVHFVELDFLRGGARMPNPPVPECDYCVILSRAETRPTAELWPLRLADPLPTVPIPLRAPDADVPIDLQAILQRVYDSSGYAHSIYDGEPTPQLSSEQGSWALKFIPRS